MRKRSSLFSYQTSPREIVKSFSIFPTEYSTHHIFHKIKNTEFRIPLVARALARCFPSSPSFSRKSTPSLAYVWTEGKLLLSQKWEMLFKSWMKNARWWLEGGGVRGRGSLEGAKRVKACVRPRQWCISSTRKWGLYGRGLRGLEWDK